VRTLERLTKEGDDSGDQLQSVHKRLRSALGVFIKNWVLSTLLTCRIKKLPEAKNWLWLLRQLSLEEGVQMFLLPSSSGGAKSVRAQRDYWEKGLGYPIEDKKPEIFDPDGPARGAIEIKVDLRKIPKEIHPHKSVMNLYGIRFVLVMWWLTKR